MVRLLIIVVVLAAVALGILVFTAPGSRDPLAVDADTVRQAAAAEAAGPAAQAARSAAAERRAAEATAVPPAAGGFLPLASSGGPAPSLPQALPPIDPAEAERLRQETADRVAAEARRQAAGIAAEPAPAEDDEGDGTDGPPAAE